MKYPTAIRVLEKNAEFMGITFEQMLTFVERNPYAVPQKVIEAYRVYKIENAEIDLALDMMREYA